MLVRSRKESLQIDSQLLLMAFQEIMVLLTSRARLRMERDANRVCEEAFSFWLGRIAEQRCQALVLLGLKESFQKLQSVGHVP